MSPLAASLGRLPAAQRLKLGWCLAVAVAGHAAMAAAMLSPSAEVRPDQRVRAATS